MEIRLQCTNVKHLDIEGHAFDIDCNSLSAMKALDSFTKATAELTAMDESLLALCKPCIDTILGGGAYDELFKDTKDSIAPYYLVLELNRIYQEEFEKDEREYRERQTKETLDQINQMANSAKVLADATDYAAAKYGGGNASAFRERAAGQHRRRG